MDDPDAYKSDLRSLSYMMDPEPGGRKLWDSDELGEIFEHQLAAPLECDLDDRDRQLSEQMSSVEGTPIGTFGDLLQHRSPPIELLQQAKDFAKACRNQPDGPVPDEIATALYFLCIAAALVKCARRITKMDDRSLRRSIDWALKQSWLDEPSQQLLRQGREALGT